MSWDEIINMMRKIEDECPESLRIVDRLMEELIENYESFTNQGCYFTVSAGTNQGSILESMFGAASDIKPSIRVRLFHINKWSPLPDLNWGHPGVC